jgi:uncharacterized membrane protein YgcG
MRKIDFAIISAVFSSNLKDALAITDSSSPTILSTTRSKIMEAVESIQIPYDGIADPSAILGLSVKENLADKLQRHSSYLKVNDKGRIATTATRNENSYDAKDNKQRNINENAKFPVQIAVTIVEEMYFGDDESNGDNDVDMEEIAGQFATSLHNKWGIGQEIIPADKDGRTENNNGGGTGVLVFLSIWDRVVFISVGGALDHILTSGRIDRIIRNDMRADLKRANYEAGLTKCIDAIVELLEIGEEPSAFEQIWDTFFNTNAIVTFVWFIFVLGSGVFQRWNRQREQRIYAKVAVRLSELDRAKAEVLRGSYQRTTSCSICLEDFSSATVGSDGHPIQLLRCGHVFDKTCYQEWVSSGCGDVTKCPVCRADVGLSSDTAPVTTTLESMAQPTTQSTTDNANAGSEANNDPNGGSSSNNGAISGFEDDIGNDNNSLAENSSDHNTHMMTLYQRDRNLRLERLSVLYPRYVTLNAVTRWSSTTFNGSLVQGQYFRNRDPMVTENARRVDQVH